MAAGMASVRPGTGRPVSLANERAFLAWARRALALLAGLAGLESVMAYRQWRANKIAMRHTRPLPPSL